MSVTTGMGALSEREKQVLALIARGRTNAEIAGQLGIRFETAKWHVSEILSKLGVDSRDEAAEAWRADRTIGRRVARGVHALVGPLVAHKLVIAAAAGMMVAAATGIVFVSVLRSGHAPVATNQTASATPALAGIDWSHRLGVYTTQVGLEQAASRSIPVRRVVAWDLDANKLASSFDYSGNGEYPVGLALAGHDVVFATEEEVVQTSVTGSTPRQLFAAAPGQAVQDIAVSPDEQLVAIIVRPAAALSPGVLYVLDLQTLQRRLVIDQSDSRFAGVRGQFWQVQWRADGQGVLVSTATQSEMYGSLATIFLDGRVRIEEIQGYGNVAPVGQMWAGDVGEIGCMTVGSHQLVVRDLDGGGILLSMASATTVYTPWEWSPDGTQFVFKQQAATTCDQVAPDGWATFVVKMNGTNFGAPSSVADLAALHREWYGDRLFSADCNSDDQPVLGRSGHLTLWCNPGAQVTVSVGGLSVGMAVAPEPVGVLVP